MTESKHLPFFRLKPCRTWRVGGFEPSSIFTPNLGVSWSNLTIVIFFKWVGSTTNSMSTMILLGKITSNQLRLGQGRPPWPHAVPQWQPVKRHDIGIMHWHSLVSWRVIHVGVPQIIHFNRVFHYKPSILGYPYFWKLPCALRIMGISSHWWFEDPRPLLGERNPAEVDPGYVCWGWNTTQLTRLGLTISHYKDAHERCSLGMYLKTSNSTTTIPAGLQIHKRDVYIPVLPKTSLKHNFQKIWFWLWP